MSSAPSPGGDLDRWVGVYERVDVRFDVRRADAGGLEVTITPLRHYGAVEPPPPRTLPMTPFSDDAFLVQPEGSPCGTPMVFREWPGSGAFLHMGLRSAPRS